jgi:hypothetical protein
VWYRVKCLQVDTEKREARGSAATSRRSLVSRSTRLRFAHRLIPFQWDVSPHVARNITTHRRSAIDARTTRPPGYEISQRIRKRVEEIFGWCKTVGNFRKTRYKGQARNQMAADFVGAAYNLLRIARLAEGPA